MEKLTRRADWQAKLTAFVISVRSKPYIIGRHDCALFAAACVREMTGKDLARGLRGYRTKAGGIRKCRSKGYRDHIDVFAQNLPPASFARSGDVVVIDGALGVCCGRFAYVLTETAGVMTLPVAKATQVFKV